MNNHDLNDTKLRNDERIELESLEQEVWPADSSTGVLNPVIIIRAVIIIL